MNQTQKILTEYIGSCLRGESVSLPEDVNRVELLLQGAKTETLLFVPDVLTDDSQFRKIAKQQVFKSMRFEQEWERLANAFETAGVDVMPLKGTWIRKFYRQEVWRPMNDIDVLYKPEQRDAVRRVMRKLDYEIYAEGERHTVWINYDIKLEVEMHHTVEEARRAGSKYLEHIWDIAVPCEGYNHVHEMTVEACYPYFMRHLQNHVTQGNLALRRVLDIYVLMLQGISADQCQEKLQDVNSLEFAYKTEALVKQLFEGIPSGDSTVDEYAEMVLGNNNYSMLLSQNRFKKSDESKIKYVLREIFPSPDKIYVTYTWVEKHKVLLPIGYICRLVEAFGVRSKNAKGKIKELKYEMNAEEKAGIKAAEELLKEIGCLK